VVELKEIKIGWLKQVEKKDVIVVFEEEPHGNWYASGVCL
jgi:hypothetical protein